MDRKKENYQRWYELNKEARSKYHKERYRVRREYILQMKKLRRAKISQHDRERYKTDVQYKLRCVLRKRVYHALKKNNKTGTTVQNLGCSIEELKTHLESKWQVGMTWDNHGQFGWHIDHIKPLDSFDLTNPEELKKACHYTNLQPLWAKDNLGKGIKSE